MTLNPTLRKEIHMSKIIKFSLIFSLVCFLSTQAFAQDSSEGSVEYDFEEDVIDGSTKSPEELYIKGLGGSKINSLITIRKDFQKEIVKSAEGI
jgi:hypothetical protein